MLRAMKSGLDAACGKIYNLIIAACFPYLAPSLRIPSHLTPRERLALMTLARQERVQVIVEIGSYLGASAAAFAAGAKFDSVIYCIDTWNNDEMTDEQRDTFSDFLVNTRRFSSKIVPVRGRSTDRQITNKIRDCAKSVDLLFIDADHSYQGVLADWKAYRPMLSANAIIAVHDIGWAEGVQRVVEEEIRPLIGEECQLPNLWWGRLAK